LSMEDVACGKARTPCMIKQPMPLAVTYVLSRDQWNSAAIL